jgi:hypothetical protein
MRTRSDSLICEWKFEKKLDKGANRGKSNLGEVRKRGEDKPGYVVEWETGEASLIIGHCFE